MTPSRTLLVQKVWHISLITPRRAQAPVRDAFGNVVNLSNKVSISTSNDKNDSFNALASVEGCFTKLENTKKYTENSHIVPPFIPTFA